MSEFASVQDKGDKVPADLRANYADHRQEQVFRYVDNGVIKEAAEVDALLAQLRAIDTARISELYRSTVTDAVSSSAEDASKREAEVMEPIASIGSLKTASDDEKNRWFKTGLRSVAEGKVAVVVLGGGQGTRLGFDGPKGVYDIGLPSGKTLFQLQAERIHRVCELAKAAAGDEGKNSDSDVSIPWYIMTSPMNDRATRSFFSKNGFFGLQESDVFFFSQGTLPCMTREGKIMLESAGRVAMAPDGNGGIYPALQRAGALEDMRARGVEHLHVSSIDNALVRVADPYFLGYCIEKGADCGNKSVMKEDPGEKVGVVVRRGGKPCVVEYSEMTREDCERRDASTGNLVFGAGNICNHYFSRAFLEGTVLPGMSNMYHVAHKKIPAAEGSSGKALEPTENNGIKLESFIFDVFPLSRNMVLFEASRADEFAPVKNAPGTAKDSPDTAREMISEQAKRWVRAAGARLGDEHGEGLCEVSPLVSYGGEGLENKVGEVLEIPFHLER